MEEENTGGAKEIRMTVRIRNNRLLEAREKLGLNQYKAAKAIGIPVTHLMDYEKMKRQPVTDTGEWKDCALKICILYEAQPDYLWTDTIMSVRSSDAVMKFGAADIPTMQAAQQPSQLEVYMNREQVTQLLDGLNKKDRKVIEMRFGIGCAEQTLSEIGLAFGVNRERIRQIEAYALGKLRKISSLLEKKDKYLSGVWTAMHLVTKARWEEESKIRRDKFYATQEELALVRKEEKKIALQENKDLARKRVNSDDKWKDHLNARRLKRATRTKALEHSAAVLVRRARAMEMALNTGEGYLNCLLKCMKEDEVRERGSG